MAKQEYVLVGGIADGQRHTQEIEKYAPISAIRIREPIKPITTPHNGTPPTESRFTTHVYIRESIFLGDLGMSSFIYYYREQNLTSIESFKMLLDGYRKAK